MASADAKTTAGIDQGVRDYRRKALALFWLAAALLALGVSPYWRINPDSALYTGLARSIATGHGYRFSGEVQSSIPIAVPVYLSFAYRLAHAVDPNVPFLGIFIYVNAFIAATAMAGLLAAFFWAAEITGVRRAVLVLLLLATSQRFFSHSIEPMTDVPYAALSWAALLYATRMEKNGRWLDRTLVAVFLALSMLTRAVGVTLLASVVIYYLWKTLRPGSQHSRHAGNLASALPAAVAALVFFAGVYATRTRASFNYVSDMTGGRADGTLVTRMLAHLWSAPAGLFESVLGLESILGLGFLLMALVILGAARLWRRGLALPGIYCVLYVAFVAASYELHPRYFTPLFPMIYVCAIEGFCAVGSWISNRFSITARALGAAAVFVFAATVAVNLFYVGREISRNFSRDFYSSYNHGKYRDYLALCGALLAREEPPEGRIMARQSRLITALTGFNTAWLPYQPDLPARPSPAETAEYADKRAVTALVIDPNDQDDAAVFRDFLFENPNWKETKRSGRLVLYERMPAGDSGDYDAIGYL